MATLKICKEIFDIFYPIGSYYETSDTNFDPNKASSWYGTWKEDSKGMVLVGMDTTQSEFKSINQTGGAKTHTLTINQIPGHTHSQNQWVFNGDTTVASGTHYGCSWKTNEGMMYNNVPSSWSSNGNTGGGQAHNNLQPYKVVKRWHRTA